VISLKVVYTADIVIQTESGVPLIRRMYEPFKNCWAIPGGHLDEADYAAAKGDIEKALQIAAVREGREEAVEGELEIIRRIGIYDAHGRDPRGNYVSHAYLARLKSGRIRAGSDAKEVKLFYEIPEQMAFDHGRILKDSKVFEK
jgi:8-oxo-dGTP diphosphatase